MSDQPRKLLERQISMATIQISSYIRTAKTISERVSLGIAMSILAVAATVTNVSEAKRLVTIAKNIANVD